MVSLADLDAAGGSKIVSDWLRLGFQVCVCLAAWLGVSFGDGCCKAVGLTGRLLGFLKLHEVSKNTDCITQ